MSLIKKTQFIELYQISDKAYGAISCNPITMSNAGFIDLGDKVIVFDTFLSLDASLELKTLIDDLTSYNQLIVINSHEHLDHILGNCVYKDDLIISSKKTFDNIYRSKGKIQFGKELYKNDIDSLNSKLKEVKDIEEINEINNTLTILKNLSNDKNQIVLPNLAISNNVNIYGSKGIFELEVIDKAHSNGDIIGYLVDDKVAYVGDLIFSGQHPYIGAGDPIMLINVLETLYNKDIDYFIPGHGNICQKDEIMNQIEYIKDLMELVSLNLDHPDKIKLSDMKEKYHSINSTTFRWNINFLTEYLK